LQPHFLFNTLNTIAELVHDDPESADRMIAGLSELLRKTLDLGEAQDVTLDEELRVLDLYLDIQRIRFGERLQVLLDVPDDARAARVPPLLLQPLVENSIRHGLAASSSAGRIEIRARRAQRRLTIDIVDDGESIAAAAPKGIGLSNVRARLEALYGDAFSLELTPAMARGTHVRIDIPSPERPA
jgi:LytS/YehU family sensor histidine kinase